MKPIQVSAHARERAISRGAALDEVAEVIRRGNWRPAQGGRLRSRGVFPFEGDWHGQTYRRKIVEPVFVETDNAIVVITVYVYFDGSEVA
jgi:hypothetical protein